MASPGFWRWLGWRAVIAACAGIVLARAVSIPAAVAAAGLWTLIGFLAWPVPGHLLRKTAATMTFIDPRPPRNTPEM